MYGGGFAACGRDSAQSRGNACGRGNTSHSKPSRPSACSCASIQSQGNACRCGNIAGCDNAAGRGNACGRFIACYRRNVCRRPNAGGRRDDGSCAGIRNAERTPIFHMVQVSGRCRRRLEFCRRPGQACSRFNSTQIDAEKSGETHSRGLSTSLARLRHRHHQNPRCLRREGDQRTLYRH